MAPTRPNDHKLGDKHNATFRLLLSGHTIWHEVVGSARKGQTWTLKAKLYGMRNLIDRVIAALGEDEES